MNTEIRCGKLLEKQAFWRQWCKKIIQR